MYACSEYKFKAHIQYDCVMYKLCDGCCRCTKNEVTLKRFIITSKYWLWTIETDFLNFFTLENNFLKSRWLEKGRNIFSKKEFIMTPEKKQEKTGNICCFFINTNEQQQLAAVTQCMVSLHGKHEFTGFRYFYVHSVWDSVITSFRPLFYTCREIFYTLY